MAACSDHKSFPHTQTIVLQYVTSTCGPFWLFKRYLASAANMTGALCIFMCRCLLFLFWISSRKCQPIMSSIGIPPNRSLNAGSKLICRNYLFETYAGVIQMKLFISMLRTFWKKKDGRTNVDENLENIPEQTSMERRKRPLNREMKHSSARIQFNLSLVSSEKDRKSVV